MTIICRFLILISLTVATGNALHAQALGSITDGRGSANAVQALQMLHQRADLAYVQKEYARAYELYVHLNKVGDKFAQFRLATLYEDGRHVQQDLVEAYAWSYLAAETGRKSLREYHLQIKSKLPAEQLPQARERASALVAEYGIFQQAIKAKDMLRSEIRKCTGSRVGSRCDAVSSSNLGCGITSDRLPETKCLRIGSLGLVAVNGVFPAQIRQVQNGLRDFISDYNPGRVELGDLELIPDQKD
jgi:hypothetical protein